MQYSAAGDSRSAGAEALQQDDTMGWLQRQQVLRQRWRAEDEAAAQEIRAVACAATLSCFVEFLQLARVNG